MEGMRRRYGYQVRRPEITARQSRPELDRIPDLLTDFPHLQFRRPPARLPRSCAQIDRARRGVPLTGNSHSLGRGVLDALVPACFEYLPLESRLRLGWKGTAEPDPFGGDRYCQ